MIYVVTSGEYSDYGIEGVFSTRELAEAFCAAKDGPDRDGVYGSCRIEEYELDPVADPNVGAYRCWLNETGQEVMCSWDEDQDATAEPQEHINDTTVVTEPRSQVQFLGVGKTKAEARAAAEERRAVAVQVHGYRSPVIREAILKLRAQVTMEAAMYYLAHPHPRPIGARPWDNLHQEYIAKHKPVDE